MKNSFSVLVLMAAWMFFSSPLALADEWDEPGEYDDRGEYEEGWEYEEGEATRPYSVPEDPLYTHECSSCHFLYLPGLLPGRSWEEVMKNTDKHFGEDLFLDEKTRDEVLTFLKDNSAEKTHTEWSRDILKSIGDKTPTRITEVPYIVKEHRKIEPEVFKRPSIGSFSNCGACHTMAAQGDFKEWGVSIPK